MQNGPIAILGDFLCKSSGFSWTCVYLLPKPAFGVGAGVGQDCVILCREVWYFHLYGAQLFLPCELKQKDIALPFYLYF